MLIDFDGVEEVIIPQFKGGEGDTVASMTVVDGNRILRGHLEPGASIGMHTHTDSCETIFVTSGIGKMIFDGVEEALSAGACHFCPKGSTHSMINTGSENLCFLAVVAKQ